MEKKLVSGITYALLRSEYYRVVYCLLFFCFIANGTLHAQCGTVINTFPYTEGFETSAAWTTGGTNSSWAWGPMSHATISSAGGGSNCWCSGGLSGASYSGGQQSWIMSPCFDFTTLNYPWISFKIFWECEYIWDGMVLQYSTNNGSTWSNLGAVGDPVNCLNANWFNYNNISNLPNSPHHGWCGRIGSTSGSCQGGNGSAGWVTAKHCMSALANLSNVRFRFLFGSGTTCNSYDGIAIDDIVISNAPPNVASFSTTCLANNAVSFTNLSAQCPTAYSWNFGDPASASSNTSSATSPSHVFTGPGVYSVSLTASGPCNAPSTTVIAVSILAVNANASTLQCNGGTNGTATVSVNGGQPAYSYTWLPAGGNASVATGLSAGVYTVSVADQNNCIKTQTTSVIQPPPTVVAFTSTNVSCFGLSDGAATAAANFGAAPYTYTWHPTNTVGNSISNVPQGSYYVTVQDAHNCLSSHTMAITEPAPLVASISASNVTCYGASNGNMVSNVTGGTTPYSYTWSPQSGNQWNLPNVGTGTYSVLVKDAHNCVASATAFISQPATPVSGSILTASPTCGTPNGHAVVTPAGGTPGYSYLWSPVGGTQASATNLNGGIYSVTITDNNNCSLTLTTSIPVSLPLSMNVITNNASCYGLANGSAFSGVSGGIPPYTYSWSVANITGQGTPNGYGFAAGTYSAEAHDSNNCPISSVFQIASPPPLAINYSRNNVSCHGGGNGSFSITVSGGTPGYNASCSSFGTIGTSVGNLFAGNYTVHVSDMHSCQTDSVIKVAEPPALAVALSHTNVLCHSDSTGSIKAQPSGGTPGYTYLWSPTGGTQPTANNLPANTYSLVLNDSHNCQLISVISLTQPAVGLSSNNVINNVSCNGGHDGGATVTINGGTAPYNYSWMGFSNMTSAFIDHLPSGDYYMTTVDGHNCSLIVTVTVSQPPSLGLTVTGGKFCSGQPGTLSAATNATAYPLTYHWSGLTTTTGSISVTVTATTIYTVFVTDSKGCASAHDTVLVSIPDPLVLHSSPRLSVCQGQNTILSATASGGDGNYSFVWQPGSMHGASQNVANVPEPSYTVSVTDGCSSRQASVVAIQFYPVPSSAITYTGSSTCPPACIAFSNDSLLKGTQMFSYSWDFGDTIISNVPSPVHCYKKSGNYLPVLNYSTMHGCTGTLASREVIYVKPAPVSDFTMQATELDATSPGVNLINLSKGATSYNWYFNTTGNSSEENPSYAFMDNGEQIITLVAENDFGCKDISSKKVNVRPEFTFYTPEVFSPNNDDLNDTFIPKGLGWDMSQYELSIYDRWGAQIFNTKRPEEGWNGKVNGNTVQDGTYVWQVLVSDVFHVRHEFTGQVLLQK